MNKRTIFVLIVMLIAILVSTPSAMERIVVAQQTEIAQQTCVPYSGGSSGQIMLSSTGGYFALQNHPGWTEGGIGTVYQTNPGATQCIYTTDTGAEGWNFSKPNRSWWPMYPNQVDVRMYGTPIAGLQTAEIDSSVTLQITSPSSSTIVDFSWDVWLYSSSGTETDEMMIWMQWTPTGNVSPCSSGEFSFGCNLQPGAYLGQVYDGYNYYDLYVYSNTNSIQGSGTLRQFHLVGNQYDPTRINLLPLINELRTLEGSSFSAAYIGSINLGTEVWQGSGSVQVNSYSLQLGGASGITTFEGPSPTTTSTSSVTTTSSLIQTTTSSTTSSSTSFLSTTSSLTPTTTSSTVATSASSQTSTPALRPPSISLSPSFGSGGSTVDVSGSGFSSSDTACSVSGAVVVSPRCSVSDGILTGAFGVANVASGSYSVTVTGTQAGDSALADFTVLSNSITLTPSSAQIGASVDVTGSNFYTTDTGCSLSGSPIGTLRCSISNGAISAAFNVTSISPGAYTITVTGSPGGDSASSTFTVESASISFNPTSALVGSNVSVSGSGFSLLDTSCSLAGSSVTSQSCILSGGRLTGSFTVANVTAGGASVTATGNPGGDTASGTFTVPGRTISLDPFYAPVGTPVEVDASGFSASDATCSLTGESVTSSTCSITGGAITATFTVANVSPGGYTVTLTGEPVGDSATVDFTVAGNSLSIALNPDSGYAGAAVHVSGSGFLSSDSSCTLTGSVVSSPTCSITSGTLTGTFTIANVPAGSYVVTAIGDPNEDVVSATFSVTVASTSQTTTISTTPVLTPDFTLESSTSLTVIQGQSGSTTVAIISLDGFASPVTLSASWVGTPPATASIQIASPITPMPNETGTSLLTVTASPTASIGTFAIQVEGTSGTLSHILSPNIEVQIFQAASTATGTTTALSSTSSTVTAPVTSSVTLAVSTTTSSIPSSSNNCPISAAVSGSALAPSAQDLRDFRDQSILKTRTGAAFMTLFNSWYYSFTPPLASYLGRHRTQRTVFGYALYPLIGLLYASYYTYGLVSPLNIEAAAVAAGVEVAGLIGFVYVAPMIYLMKRILRRKLSLTSAQILKSLLATSAASAVALVFAYSEGTALALAFAATDLLLSSLAIGATVGILALNHVRFASPIRQLATMKVITKPSTICLTKRTRLPSVPST